MHNLSSLHDMVLFVEVARTLNFSAAGRSLGVPAPTLSRRIAAMEARPGARLFERSTRRVELTDAGRRYFDRCAHLADEVQLAEEALVDWTEQPGGHLRLSMLVDLGLHIISPVLYEFGLRYPMITFELDLSPTHRDLADGNTDIAFRLGSVKRRAVDRPAHRIYQTWLCAAPAYLKSRGYPQQPADLAAHQCIGVTGASNWKLTNGELSIKVAVHGRFATNNLGLMKALAERGAGIAALSPMLLVDSRDRGMLEPALAGWELPNLSVYAVTTSRLQPTRVKLLIDFLAPRLEQ